MSGSVGYTVWLRPGSVERKGGFSLIYTLSGIGAGELCKIPDTGVAFSTIRSPSGSGKSTLIERLMTCLHDSTAHNNASLSFDATNGSDEKVALDIAIIPQTPPFVKHWRVSTLLPPDSTFGLAAFSPNWDTIQKRPLGQLSGGQQRRVYVCSALEKLASKVEVAAVVVLDETLDGLNPNGAGDFVNRVSAAWIARQDKPLYLLIVSHLPNIRTSVPEKVTAQLEVIKEAPNSLTVKVTL